MVSPSSLSGPYRWQEYFAALTNLFQSGDITTRSDISTAPADYGTLLTVSRDKRGKVLGWEARNRLISVKKGGALSITEYATASGKFFVVNSHRYNFKPGSPGLREFRIDYEGTGKPRHFNSDGQGGLPTHALFPKDHLLEMTDFNALLAIVTAICYIETGKYPIEKGNALSYNKKLNVWRKKLR